MPVYEPVTVQAITVVGVASLRDIRLEVLLVYSVVFSNNPLIPSVISCEVLFTRSTDTEADN